MREDRRNRPRVFLSHSKTDLGFIKRVHDDLRSCHVESWLDSEEIRHGQPWLDAIFESGIPTCDAVLVYLTEASLKSQMVKKEMDASILQKLKDGHIAFLPYVAQGGLRESLRADIQALQVPEWNESNYSNLFPQVVAEVWHSYMERMLVVATSEEKSKRLAAELELERARKMGGEGIFSDREEKDFSYILTALDRYIAASLMCKRSEKFNGPIVETHTEKMTVHLGSLVTVVSQRRQSNFSHWMAENAVLAVVQKHYEVSSSGVMSYEVTGLEGIIENELLMYGLLEFIQNLETYSSDRAAILRSMNPYMFTPKMNRFKYWLAIKGKLPNEILWKPDGPVAEPTEG
jgi:hypothetical protein